MAKKKQSAPAEVLEAPMVQEQATIVEPEIPKVEKVQKPSDKWEIRDRVYFLKGKEKPVSFILKSKGIYWFDEEKGYEREITLTGNQKTLFEDEMKGIKRLENVIFRDGVLTVPKNKVNMQKLLSIYHPQKNITYYEYDPKTVARVEVDTIENELDAMNAVNSLDIDMAEAVLRAEMGSDVSKMSSKEIRRDLLVLARNNPGLIMGLINDENLYLRNIGIKCVEAGILSLSKDNRHFTYTTSGQKLMTVPFDEHPYTALAAWFKTDEGMEVLTAIEKKIS
tara:strand:+ start:440 stop:1279 length:840 start_codon:yes stop_codon:yes gene_type:complete